MIKAESAYQYYLLPSANPPAHLEMQHNLIHKFWKESWEEVLQELGADASQLDDDFIRQDFVAAICSGTEVVAVHLYSIFSLTANASLGHRYLKGNYPPEFFANLKSKGVRTVMSMEYLTVNPAWRRSSGSIHMGAILGALGLEVMQHFGVDAAIAPARRDLKVNLIAYSLGGECIVENVLNHNVRCDLIAIRHNRVQEPAPDLAVLRDQLWLNRIHVDASGIDHNPAVRVLKLAA